MRKRLRTVMFGIGLMILLDPGVCKQRYYKMTLSDYITPDYPPTYHWYGKNDLTLMTMCWSAQGPVLEKALARNHVTHIYHVYDDAPHAVAAGKGTDAETLLAGKTIDSTYGKYLGAEISAELKDVNAKVGYFKYKDMFENGDLGKGLENKLLYVGADYTVGDVNVAAMYLKGDGNDRYVDTFGKADDDGVVVTLSYKGAEADEVGSWGLFATYYNQGGQTYVAHTTDANTFDNKGFKGYGIGANYTFAKNMVGTVVYYDTENKLDSKEDDQRLWADLTFTF